VLDAQLWQVREHNKVRGKMVENRERLCL